MKFESFCRSNRICQVGLVAGGLPSERIDIKPNFLPHIPGLVTERKKYAVFVGRLSEERG